MGLNRLEPLASLSASPVCVGTEEVTMVRRHLAMVPIGACLCLPVSRHWPLPSASPYSLSILPSLPRLLNPHAPQPYLSSLALFCPFYSLLHFSCPLSFWDHFIFPTFLAPSIFPHTILSGPASFIHFTHPHPCHPLLATLAAQEALFHIQAVWLLQIFQVHPLWDILTATQGRTSQA